MKILNKKNSNIVDYTVQSIEFGLNDNPNYMHRFDLTGISKKDIEQIKLELVQKGIQNLIDKEGKILVWK